MSTVTPNSQTRSGHPRDWGNYADPQALPNRPSFVAPTTKLEPLEEGDTAYVTGQGRWYCEYIGSSPGAGDAIWRNDLVTLWWEEVERTISVKGQSGIFLPFGAYVLAEQPFLEAFYDNGSGSVPLVFGTDWEFCIRQRGNWPEGSTRDVAVGIWLLFTSSVGDKVRLRWRTGKINISPPTPVQAYAPGNNIPPPSGGYGSQDKWRADGTPFTPNAVLFGARSDFQIEIWRMMYKSGEVREPTVLNPGYLQYRGGRRFDPYYRARLQAPGELIINPLDTFRTAQGRKSTYRACFYDPMTGARSELSAEKIIYLRQRKDNIANQIAHVAPCVWVTP